MHISWYDTFYFYYKVMRQHKQINSVSAIAIQSCSVVQHTTHVHSNLAHVEFMAVRINDP